MPGYNPNYDPFDEAMAPPEPGRFAGRVSVDAWQCVLLKGQGKVPFDPEQHKGQRTSVAIEITIEPLDPTRKLIQREMLNWTPDFRQVVQPSVVALGEQIAKIVGQPVDQINPLRAMSGLWASGVFVPQPDNKEGETWTTLKFEAVYASEDECREAVGAEPDEEPDTKPADNTHRATLAKFLPALWEQAGQDHAAFIKLIAENPILAPHFSATSVEVMAVEAGFE